MIIEGRSRFETKTPGLGCHGLMDQALDAVRVDQTVDVIFNPAVVESRNTNKGSEEQRCHESLCQLLDVEVASQLPAVHG